MAMSLKAFDEVIVVDTSDDAYVHYFEGSHHDAGNCYP